MIRNHCPSCCTYEMRYSLSSKLSSSNVWNDESDMSDKEKGNDISDKEKGKAGKS